MSHGRVIIQTYNPDNYAICYAKNQNYDDFYKTEIDFRKVLKYPPFCDIILIGFTGEKEEEIKQISSYLFKTLKQILEKYNIKVFEPVPSPIDKIKNKYRWRIIAKGNVTKDVTIILNKCLQNIYAQNRKHTNISIDINPNNMM